MSQEARPRHCSRCGIRLALDNADHYCAACRARARDEVVRPPVMPRAFWFDAHLRSALDSWHFGRLIAAYRSHPHHARVLPQETVAGWLNMTQAQLSRIENGPPPTDLAKLTHWAVTLDVPGELLWFKLPTDKPTTVHRTAALVRRADKPPVVSGPSSADEGEALELARRVAASDVGHETLSRLEAAFDELAIAYAVSPPRDLIARLRLHLAYVNRLMDGRKTLDEHRRLLVVGGWLSLLAATVHIDLKQNAAATARLRTASSLAQHAEHDEIQAWCLETIAWRAVTDGDFQRAVRLAQAAQAIAPTGSSAHTQATAQEGRAWARLGQASETYDAMERVHGLVASRPAPDQPGHHYRYDPDKLTAYSATTLAWLGDPAAEEFARQLLTRLNGTEATQAWPRRVASAHLDLSLTLLGTDRLDEAASEALIAIGSGHVAPSNHWRALEVVTAVESRELPEAADLREAYESLRTR